MNRQYYSFGRLVFLTTAERNETTRQADALTEVGQDTDMNKAYKSIAKGLQEAIALSRGKRIAARTHRPAEVDVVMLRPARRLRTSRDRP